MFQRIRGAIDARIAEEQARQRPGQDPLSRSNSAARRPARVRRDGSYPTRGPDPAEFDADFIVADEDGSTGTNTPGLETEKPPNGATIPSSPDGRETPPVAQDSGNNITTPTELPTEARVKLRRLDKLEGRYQELLKAYRTAHARVISIEPFEASLRENTPLTSIGDPRAFTEYLNQISLKGDMVVEELKRVTTEREDFKSKLESAEKATREAWDEVASLKDTKTSGDGEVRDVAQQNNEQPLPSIQTTVPSAEEDFENSQKSPTASIASRATSIRGLSLFSPKMKPVKSPPPTEENEEFFSFDNEIPRLESELKDREKEVVGLKTQVKTLTGDLAVARESTEGMVHSLESATRELGGLRDSKERHETELENQRKSSEEQISVLNSKLLSVSSELETSKSQVQSIKTQLQDKEQELKKSKEDALTRDRQIGSEGPNDPRKQAAADKRLAILQGIVNNLKSQLKDAESTVSSLKAELLAKNDETNLLQRIVVFVDNGLEGNDNWNIAKDLIANNQAADFGAIRQSLLPANTEKSSADTIAETTNTQPSNSGAGPGKKKNKKKKKGTKADTSDVAKPNPINTQPPQVSPGNEAISDLEKTIEKLEAQITEKDAAIERLHSKLKGEETLREEIESLRDDILNVGQDHVEAKDKIKELTAEKSALTESMTGLEKELVTLRSGSEESSLDSEKAHKELMAELKDMKIKSTGLETDLSAAQQLAASRFKDLTDLREVLQKIQPELRNLRAESTELKTAKEELKAKSSQVSDLERRHEDLRSEMKTLKSTISDRDSEAKTLNQKISQETNSRLKAEKSLEVAQSDLLYSEGQRQDAIETNEKTLKNLSRTQEELRSSRSKLREVEDQIAQLNRDIGGLREEIQLKTAQHASAQSLMSSMRDQTSEMAMQVKEATERCESLEEEVTEAHRLLSERTREGETMRRLLSDVEMKADIKVREFKDRLEAAIEERDRAEEEASTVGRRRAREMEELKTKAREAERALRRAEEDKDELEHTQKDWKRRRSELEAQVEHSDNELADVKTAMSHLRDALDESERQTRELEKEKSELRRSVEETNQRLEKLRRSNKILSDDLKGVQSTKRRGIDSTQRSPRSSLESGRHRGMMSPSPADRNGSHTRSDTLTGPGSAPIDYVYLKNVLLQFLEQKDKKHQKQLIPVLGMLLHFDTTDEQKWMSAISSRG